MSATRRVRWLAVYAAAWTPLVLVYSVLIGASNRLATADAVASALITVGKAAVLGLCVAWWTRRSGFPTDAPRRVALRHLGGAVAYAVAWNAWVLLDIRAGATWAATFDAVRSWIGWQLFFSLIVYATIAGILTSIEGAGRARAQELRVREAEAQRARAELEALRGRLDPHFLFNTLHTVGALVRRDPAAAESALERLADLLRYVLDGTRDRTRDVPLDDELGFVDAYVALEAMRLGDRLRVAMDIDDDLRDAPVPSLLLQPLVENAVRHGIAPKPSGGTVHVRARRAAGGIELEVADDGVGAAAVAPPSGHGIGLDGLRQRLAARYGAAASCRVRTAPGQGFSVTVHLPA